MEIVSPTTWQLLFAFWFFYDGFSFELNITVKQSHCYGDKHSPMVVHCENTVPLHQQWNAVITNLYTPHYFFTVSCQVAVHEAGIHTRDIHPNANSTFVPLDKATVLYFPIRRWKTLHINTTFQMTIPKIVTVETIWSLYYHKDNSVVY